MFRKGSSGGGNSPSGNSIDNEYGLQSPTHADSFSYGSRSSEDQQLSKAQSFMREKKEATESANAARKASTYQAHKDHVLARATTFVDDIRKEGILRKRGHVVKNWKDRYFTLEDGVLSYAEAKGGKVKGTLDLIGHELLVDIRPDKVQVSGVVEGKGCVFKITVSDTKMMQRVRAKSMSKSLGKVFGAGADNISVLGVNMSDGYRKTLFLACEGHDEMMSWVYAIQAAWVGPEGDTAIMLAAREGDVAVTVKGGSFDDRAGVVIEKLANGKFRVKLESAEDAEDEDETQTQAAPRKRSRLGRMFGKLAARMPGKKAAAAADTAETKPVPLTITKPKLDLKVSWDEEPHTEQTYACRFNEHTNDVEATSAEEREQRAAIRAGMVLMAVNGRSMVGVPEAEVKSLLASSDRPLELQWGEVVVAGSGAGAEGQKEQEEQEGEQEEEEQQEEEQGKKSAEDASEIQEFEASELEFTQLTKLRKICELGLDINLQNSAGYTAAMHASSCGQLECLKQLLTYGADPNMQTVNGTTALMITVNDEQPQCMRWLCERTKANLYAANGDGCNALMLAVISADLEAVRYLLQCMRISPPTGAEEHAGATTLTECLEIKTERKGYTPVMLAAQGGDAEIVSCLIDARADLNAVHEDTGNNSLMWAAMASHNDVVQLLMERGADMHHVNNQNANVKAIAERANNVKGLRMLSAGLSRFALLPRDARVDIGSTATFTVVACGTPTPELHWRFNGVPISEEPLAMEHAQRGLLQTSFEACSLEQFASMAERLGLHLPDDELEDAQDEWGDCNDDNGEEGAKSKIGSKNARQLLHVARSLLADEQRKVQKESDAKAAGPSKLVVGVLTVQQCSEEMMGRYSVYAKNEVGTCLARVVNLRNTIAVRAAKGGQPESATLDPGSDAKLSFAAEGDPAPSYQWYKCKDQVQSGGAGDEKSLLAGATKVKAGTGAETSTLMLPSVRREDDGRYFCVASNSAGRVVSDVAHIAVNTAPEALSPAHGHGGDGGVDATLSVATVVLSISVGGTPAPTLQWKRNGSTMKGEREASVEVEYPEPGSEPVKYTCVATNGAGEQEFLVAELPMPIDELAPPP